MSTKEKFRQHGLLGHIGKVGLVIMIAGLVVLYADAYMLMQEFPLGYHYYDHPKIHIPAIGMLIAFSGAGIFIINFIKGRKVI